MAQDLDPTVLGPTASMIDACSQNLDIADNAQVQRQLVSQGHAQPLLTFGRSSARPPSPAITHHFGIWLPLGGNHLPKWDNFATLYKSAR